MTFSDFLRYNAPPFLGIFFLCVSVILGTYLAVPQWLLPYASGMMVYQFQSGRPVRAIAWLFYILLSCFLCVIYFIYALLAHEYVKGNPAMLAISLLVYLGQTAYWWGLSLRRSKNSTRALRSKIAVGLRFSALMTFIALGALLFLKDPWY